MQGVPWVGFPNGTRVPKMGGHLFDHASDRKVVIEVLENLERGYLEEVFEDLVLTSSG